MNAIKARITAANLGNGETFITVKTPGQISATMGGDVVMVPLLGFDGRRLAELRDYLEDRPSLMSDSEVAEGVKAIKAIIGSGPVTL